MKEALSSSETSVLTRATRLNVPELFIVTAVKTSNLIHRHLSTDFLENVATSRPHNPTGLSQG
jgi:hypothetical protein